MSKNEIVHMPADKALHVMVGLVIAVLGAFFGAWLLPERNPLFVGLLMTLLAAWLKETWDYWTGKGTADTLDFYATLGGAGAGLFIYGFARELMR